MPYRDFLHAVIDDGIEAVRQDYAKPRQTLHRDGAVAGFEACRNLEIEEIVTLLDEARGSTAAARRVDVPDYWYWRCRESEIEWVLNVVSAARYAHRLPAPVQPTARGLLKAFEILGGEPPG